MSERSNTVKRSFEKIEARDKRVREAVDYLSDYIAAVDAVGMTEEQRKYARWCVRTVHEFVAEITDPKPSP